MNILRRNVLLIFLFTWCYGLSVYSQNVQILTDLYSEPIDKYPLEEQSRNIAEVLGTPFTIYDASFYALTSSIGTEYEDHVWDMIKEDLEEIGTGNYVILARVQDIDNAKVKVLLHISPESIVCEEEVTGIEDKIMEYEAELQQAGNDIAGLQCQELQLFIAKILYAKINNICCDLLFDAANGRKGPTSCSEDQIKDFKSPCKLPKKSFIVTPGGYIHQLPKGTPVSFDEYGRLQSFYAKNNYWSYVGGISTDGNVPVEYQSIDESFGNPPPIDNNFHTNAAVFGRISAIDEECACVFYTLKLGKLFSSFERTGTTIQQATSPQNIIDREIQDISNEYCPSLSRKSQIKLLLSTLFSQVPPFIDLEYIDGNETFTLEEGELVKIDNPISASKIKDGEWVDTSKDVRIRLEKNSEGMLQINTIGFYKELTSNTNKTFSPANLSDSAKLRINTFFSNYNVINGLVTPANRGINLNNTSEVFADGDKLLIDNGSSYWKIAIEATDIVTNLLKTAKVKEQVYLHSSQDNMTIHAPGLVTGSVEVAVEVVTNITSLCVVMYDLAVDRQKRTDMWSRLVKLKTEIDSDPSKVLPIIKTVLMAAFTGNTIEEWRLANSETTDKGKRSHLTTRGTVSIFASITGGSFFVKLGSTVDKLIIKIKKFDFDDIDLSSLRKDFLEGANSSNFRQHIDANPDNVKVWDRIRTAAKNANPNLPDPGKILRTDIPSLTALSKFDDALINSIGQQRFDNFLEKLIKANPKCSTCGNAGDALVGNLDNVLDDFHKVATERAVGPNGGFVQGFDDFMTEVGEQASKAKAAALTLKKMSNNWDELTEGGYSLTRFEGNIPDIETGHKLDLLFERTNANGITELKSVEMKNWSSAQTIPSSQGTQYYAYISSGNKFEYYFSDGIREAMKTKFQSIYKNSTKATELFNLNPSYFTSQNIPNATVLNNLANQGGLVTHPTFMNFVK